jgi:hypothetical protein
MVLDLPFWQIRPARPERRTHQRYFGHAHAKNERLIEDDKIKWGKNDNAIVRGDDKSYVPLKCRFENNYISHVRLMPDPSPSWPKPFELQIFDGRADAAEEDLLLHPA